MSAEYFCVEEVKNPKFYDGYGSDAEKRLDDTPAGHQGNDQPSVNAKHGQDTRLHEIEEQLQLAENRCNTLKGQLDYMKKVYHKANIDTPRNSDRKTNRTESDTPIRKSFDMRSVSPNIRHASRPPNKDPEVLNSNRKFCSSSSSKIRPITDLSLNTRIINNDTTGAAVRTINHILTGITDSVNRLSDIHAHISNDERSRPVTPAKNKMFTQTNIINGVEVINFAPKEKKASIEKILEPRLSEPSLVEEVARNNAIIYSAQSQTIQKSKKRTRGFKPFQATKAQTSSGSVNIGTKKTPKISTKQVEKKMTLNPPKSAVPEIENNFPISTTKRQKRQLKRLKPSSKTILRRKGDVVMSQSYQQTTNNLIELYHNEEAQESDSDESTNDKSDNQKKASDEILKIDLSINSRKESATSNKVSKKSFTRQRSREPLTPINENEYTEPAAPRVEVSNMCNAYSKNYELPTISSKMKQVAKCYLHSFNFKSIPFCAAKSTSPSHNIGINIQQVMSIIKTRQPLEGISPTLAHNIGIAAEKLNNRPLTALVSSLSSRMWYGKSQCPLNRSSMNYQQLTEMAKDIPEEDENMVGDGQEDISGANGDAVYNGPSGDCDKHGDRIIWTLDPAKQRNCTCASQSGIGFQQVVSKYHSNYNPSVTNYSGSQMQYSAGKNYRTSKRQYMQALRTRNHPAMQQVSAENYLDNEANGEMTPLKGKEKTLKEVLKNLHNDFDTLNNKYEELSAHARDGTIETNDETVKELEKMEKNLTDKEEEIKMVMALYKEVLALKQQVKTLKERTSQASFPVKEQISRFKEYRDPTAALHLTKLLRQIQNYQMNYKRGSSMY